MFLPSRFLFAALFLFTLSTNAKIPTFLYDGSLKKSHQILVKSDLAALEAVELNPKTNGVFTQVFSGLDSQSVLDFLELRIKVLLDESVDPDDRIFEQSLALDGVTPNLDPAKGSTIADNLGFVLWLFAETMHPKKFLFQTSGQMIPLDSSRVGIIRLGGAYTDNVNEKGPNNKHLRIATLIHESRHSDCTGGVTVKELAYFAANGEMPAGVQCGHMHTVCPPGHELAGEPACDDHAWGPYVVEAIYSATYANTCSQCLERDKQQSYYQAADAFNRVSGLQELLDGNVGPPDMSSKGVLRVSSLGRSELQVVDGTLVKGRGHVRSQFIYDDDLTRVMEAIFLGSPKTNELVQVLVNCALGLPSVVYQSLCVHNLERANNFLKGRYNKELAHVRSSSSSNVLTIQRALAMGW